MEREGISRATSEPTSQCCGLDAQQTENDSRTRLWARLFMRAANLRFLRLCYATQIRSNRRSLNPVASLSVDFSKAAVDLRAGLLAPQLRICQITQGSFQ